MQKRLMGPFVAGLIAWTVLAAFALPALGQTATVAASCPTLPSDIGTAGLNQTTAGRLCVDAAVGSAAITSVVPGTGATNLGKAEDAAHSSGDTGEMPLAVRQDTIGTPLAGSSGDYIPLVTDSYGLLATGPDSGTPVNGGNCASGACSLTATGTLVTLDMTGYLSTTVRSGTYSATVLAEQSNDNSTWDSLTCILSTAGVSNGSTGTSTIASGGLIYNCPRVERYQRFRVSAYTSGTASVTPVQSKMWQQLFNRVEANIVGQAAHDAAVFNSPVRVAGRGISASYATVATGDTTDLITTLDGRLITNPLAIPENTWAYAAATGGISNTTTAVTIKAADGALRNYVDSCQISSDPLGAATEFAIRDGAAGTVLWRMKIGTAGIVNGLQIAFMPALRGTAATLTEIVTLTASITGGVFVNCQGHVAP